jgi:molybdopterin-guanine dinucleotide biosynthesis protein A
VSAPHAIVLAGGRSSRFGTDKLAVLVDGEPILHHALRAVAAMPAEGDIVLVIGLDAPVPALPLDLGACVRVERDPEAFGGPLVGLAAALAVLPDDALVIVVAGDMPSLRPPVLRLLAETLAADLTADVALLQHDEPAPLPAALRVYAARAAAGRALAGGDRSLRSCIAALTVTFVPSAAWRALDADAATLRDVDTPADLGA